MYCVDKGNAITDRELNILTLSPFTILELFCDDLGHKIAAYLPENKKMIVPKGYVFFEQGEVVDSIFYLKDGVAMETIMNENGLKKNFLVASQYPLGLHYCGHHQPIFPDTTAYTECEVYKFTYDEFLKIMQKDIELLRNIIHIISIDFRLANSSAMQNYTCSTHEKICQTLLSYFIASKYNSHIRNLKLTQEFIAELTGVHRISVVRSMQKLKQEGIIAYTQNQIKLIDYDNMFETAYHMYAI